MLAMERSPWVRPSTGVATGAEGTSRSTPELAIPVSEGGRGGVSVVEGASVLDGWHRATTARDRMPEATRLEEKDAAIMIPLDEVKEKGSKLLLNCWGRGGSKMAR